MGKVYSMVSEVVASKYTSSELTANTPTISILNSAEFTGYKTINHAVGMGVYISKYFSPSYRFRTTPLFFLLLYINISLLYVFFSFICILTHTFSTPFYVPFFFFASSHAPPPSHTLSV